MKTQWKAVLGGKWLPMRRETKPTGRITLFGKELTAKETKLYCKSLSNLK